MTLSSDETTQLRNYTLAKQQVTASVRAMKQFLEAQREAERGEHVQALLAKLAEDRFNLAADSFYWRDQVLVIGRSFVVGLERRAGRHRARSAWDEA